MCLACVHVLAPECWLLWVSPRGFPPPCWWEQGQKAEESALHTITTWSMPTHESFKLKLLLQPALLWQKRKHFKMRMHLRDVEYPHHSQISKTERETPIRSCAPTQTCMALYLQWMQPKSTSIIYADAAANKLLDLNSIGIAFPASYPDALCSQY